MPKSLFFHKYCSTKAKRAGVMAALAGVCELQGAAVEVEIGDKESVMHATAESGHRFMFILEGDIDLGCFLVHWHMSHDEKFKGVEYPVTFGADIRGEVNRFHGRKATGQYSDLETLLHFAGRGFEVLKEES